MADRMGVGLAKFVFFCLPSKAAYRTRIAEAVFPGMGGEKYAPSSRASSRPRDYLISEYLRLAGDAKANPLDMVDFDEDVRGSESDC